MTEGELDGLLGEIGGACSYDNMVKMFQEELAAQLTGGEREWDWKFYLWWSCRQAEHRAATSTAAVGRRLARRPPIGARTGGGLRAPVQSQQPPRCRLLRSVIKLE